VPETPHQRLEDHFLHASPLSIRPAAARYTCLAKPSQHVPRKPHPCTSRGCMHAAQRMRTAEVQGRELRHPHEARGQRRHSLFEVVPCTHSHLQWGALPACYSPAHDGSSRSMHPVSMLAQSDCKPQRLKHQRCAACSERTTEVERRQLRHPQEDRRKIFQPSCSNTIDCNAPPSHRLGSI
jgi:hypothetical protein